MFTTPIFATPIVATPMNVRRIMPLVAVVLPFFVSPVHAHVELGAPNGGETLEVGSVFVIEWRLSIPHSQENWDLFYSIEGPEGRWIPIVLDLPLGGGDVETVHTHDWTLPAEAVSEQVWVRVLMDNEEFDYDDVSDESFIVAEPVTEPEFKRGNADAQGSLDITDGIFVLNFLFLGGDDPPCLDAADTDDSGAIDLSDGVAVFNFLFLTGPAPRDPGANVCGPDPTPDDGLDCREFSSCS